MSKQVNSDQQWPLAATTTYDAGVIQSAAFRLLKRFTDDCLKDYGITTTQWFIIGTVNSAGPGGVRLTELAQTVDTTLSFLTNAVNQLEAKGYLARVEDINDSRSKNISVPLDMQQKVTAIEEYLRGKMRDGLYRHIDRDDLQTYVKVLFQISQLQVKAK